jgi:hypothetical protein
MMIFRYLFIIFATIVMACGGGGGDTNGSTPDPSSDTPLTNIEISSFLSSIPTFGKIELSIDPSPASQIQNLSQNGTSAALSVSGPTFTVEIDLEGEGTFKADKTIEAPALVSGDKLIVAAPMQAFVKTEAILDPTFAIRVIRKADNAISNTIYLTEERTHVPSELRGIPSTALDLVFKAIYQELDDTLATESSGMRPGVLFDDLNVLGLDTSLLDEQADAIMTALFGVSVVDQLSGVSIAANNDERTVDEESHHAIGGGNIDFSTSEIDIQNAAKTLKSFSQIKGAFERIISCMDYNIQNFLDLSYEDAGEACWTTSINAIRGDFIDGLSDIQGKVALFAGTVSSLANLGTKTFVGGYSERLGRSAAMGRYTTTGAKIALTLPTINSDPDQNSEYILDQLTSTGKSIIYEELTKDIPEAGQLYLEILGAPDLLSDTIDRTAEEVAALRNLEGSLEKLRIGGQRFLQFPQLFGGQEDSEPAPIYIPNIGNIDVLADGPNAADVCASNPELSWAMTIGFASCEEFIEPFLDQRYFVSTLLPTLEAIQSVATPEQLLSCANDTNDITPQCEQWFNDISLLNDQLIDSLLAYANEDFHCDSGYSEYEAGTSNTLTCIHESLDYVPSGANCYDGSRPSGGFDVGNANICVYYSRDYFQEPGHYCRENYQEVFFLGQNRCRWSGLPPNSVAAYSKNRTTGDTMTLED